MLRPSRFAVLHLEDDDIFDKKPEKLDSNLNQNINKKNDKNKAHDGTDSKQKPKKKKKNNDIAELQSLAFGNGISKTKSKSNQNPTAKSANPKQWEEWKKKDSEFVSGAYEQDLQQALLLSKIDYEEKKDVYDAIQSEPNKLGQKKKKKNNQKKEKGGTMSLEEFQNLESGKEKLDTLDDFSSPPKPPVVTNMHDNFFEKLEEDVEKIVYKEQRNDSYKKREDNAQVPDIALCRDYQEKLNKKDEEIEQLKEEITRLKTDLKTVKNRNKKLYDILAAGEMKEKAEILVAVEDLTTVKDELTEQLNEYHQSLEIERSKVHALQTELKKCQNTKKDRKDS